MKFTLCAVHFVAACGGVMLQPTLAADAAGAAQGDTAAPAATVAKAAPSQQGSASAPKGVPPTATAPAPAPATAWTDTPRRSAAVRRR